MRAEIIASAADPPSSKMSLLMFINFRMISFTKPNEKYNNIYLAIFAHSRPLVDMAAFGSISLSNRTRTIMPKAERAASTTTPTALAIFFVLDFAFGLERD